MNKRIVRGMVCLLVGVVLLGGSVKAEEECVICKSLGEAGFPESYRTALCALQLARPSWHFEALPITALSREKGKNYDFSTVVEEEWRVAGRSLVSARKEYGAYAEADSKLFYVFISDVTDKMSEQEKDRLIQLSQSYNERL